MAQRISGWLLLAILMFACPGPTSAAPARTPAEGWRFLLVVETSRAMSGRQEAALKLLHELIASGMRGEALPGDSLGVWTFNSELRTGQLPLQRWNATNATEIANTAVEFLRAQTNEHAPRIERALVPVCQLAEHSDGLTVVLATSGQPVRGTPFDEQINNITFRWKDYQDEKNLPFVTVLRVQKAQFTDFTVTPLPWPLSWPWPPRAIVKTGESSDSTPGAPRVVQSPKAKTSPPISNEKKSESRLSPSGQLSDELTASVKPTPRVLPVSQTPSVVIQPSDAANLPTSGTNAPRNPLQVDATTSETVDAAPRNATQAEPVVPESSTSDLKHVTTLNQQVSVRSSNSVAHLPPASDSDSVAASTHSNTPQTLIVAAAGEGTPPASDDLNPAASARTSMPTRVSALLPDAAEDATLGEATKPASDPLPRDLDTTPSSTTNRLPQLLAGSLGLGGLGALVWLLRAFRRPHRASIITQSFEREGGHAARTRLYEHLAPATPETLPARGSDQPR